MGTSPSPTQQRPPQKILFISILPSPAWHSPKQYSNTLSPPHSPQPTIVHCSVPLLLRLPPSLRPPLLIASCGLGGCSDDGRGWRFASRWRGEFSAPWGRVGERWCPSRLVPATPQVLPAVNCLRTCRWRGPAPLFCQPLWLGCSPRKGDPRLCPPPQQCQFPVRCKGVTCEQGATALSCQQQEVMACLL